MHLDIIIARYRQIGRVIGGRACTHFRPCSQPPQAWTALSFGAYACLHTQPHFPLNRPDFASFLFLKLQPISLARNRDSNRKFTIQPSLTNSTPTPFSTLAIGTRKDDGTRDLVSGKLPTMPAGRRSGRAAAKKAAAALGKYYYYTPPRRTRAYGTSLELLARPRLVSFILSHPPYSSSMSILHPGSVL